MTNNIKTNLEAIFEGIRQNKIVETFEKYYDEKVVMFEKGDSTNRVGKEENRVAEQGFQSNATIHELKIIKLLIDGLNSAYESEMTFTYGGNKVTKTQWAIQQWTPNGLIVKEEFF
ncbi:hypothetical protein CYY_001696 [Polysphondylium violaceum]|uniref:SnoaL-like domain-containing protein n=1 Tax=Polysphondylium violaceum TaxID=133409 RepID=A0A8J4Q1G9_9MYCE|nr:hypothetical protein CYY_001696 [Polysphondylium violaceum]